MTKLDEAREALYREISEWGNKHPGHLVKGFEALIDAKLSPAPVGEDDCLAGDCSWCGPRGEAAPTPPAEGSAGGNATASWDNSLAEANEKIADLEARLAEEKAIRAHREDELSAWLRTAESDADENYKALAEARKRNAALDADTKRMAATLLFYKDGPTKKERAESFDVSVRSRMRGWGLSILQGKHEQVADEARAILSPASEGKTDG